MAVLLSDEEEVVELTYADTRKWELMRIVVGQRETPPDGWHSIWCIDCDKCSEPFEGSLESFIECIAELGWDVVNVNNATAIGPCCQDAPDTAVYASQYEDNRGLLG